MELSAKSDHAAALAEWTAIAAGHPGMACIETHLGFELLHTGDASSAIPHFEKAIALDPSSAEAHNDLGAALLADPMHAQSDRAEREFKRAIELNPKYAEAQTNLGNLYLDEGNAPQAEQLFRGATASDPRFIKAYLSLARTLAEQSQLAEADAVLTNALAIDPTSRPTQRLQKQIRSMMKQ
jgi:Tfp pilus assembly protein PilF